MLLNRIFRGVDPVPLSLPLEDVERGLKDRCAVPARDPKAPDKPHIPNSNFKQIRSLLQHLESHRGLIGWSARPRLYTILRIINRLDAMQTFINHQLLDYSLPFSLANIPHELGDSRRDFIRVQDLVLTDARELEKGIEGQHVRFSKSGDEHFHRVRELGSGGFGYVDHVWSRLSLKPYARKRFRRGNDFRENQRRSHNFEQEIKVLKRLSHKHLIKIVGSYTDQLYFAFIMTPVAECNLEAFLQRKHESQRDENSQLTSLRQYFGCLTNAVAYLHSRKIQHMDIKPDNILIKHGRVYVADFGAAHDWSTKSRSTTFAPSVSTPGYRAPEVAKDPHAPKNSMTDMWSLGVVFLEIATVLRGRSVRKFRQYLTQNGSKHAHVYGNSQATYQWFDIIRCSDAGPDSDVEPLTWIRDMIDLDPLNRPEAKALAGQISNRTFSGNFCGICCSQADELWDNSYAVDLALSPDNSVIEYKEDDDDNESIAGQENLHQSWVADSTGSPSIETWLNLQDNTNIDLEVDNSYRPAPEYDQLPYEVIEDEDIQEPVTRVFYLPDYLPERLSTFDILEEGNGIDLPEDQYEVITEDEELDLPYQIVSDDSCSEATVRQTDAPPEWLSQLSDEDLLSPPMTAPAESLDKMLRKDVLTSEAQECLSEPIKANPSAAAVHRSDSSNDIANAGAKSPEDVSTIAVHSVSPDASSNSINSESSAFQTPGETPIIAVHPMPADPSKNSVIPESSTLHTHPPRTSTSKRPSKAARRSYKPDVTAALTAENLARLHDSRMNDSTRANDHDVQTSVQSPKSSLRPEPRISAKSYMHETWEAESSAVTSIMSANTMLKLGRNISMLPWQDRSFKYLDHYAKQGQAAAVRYLLEAKCNPGTRGKPRPEPLFNAVRGGSERHNKCVRALLEYGADVNMTNGSSGKTPLHYAIEHREFKGYRNLIFILLNGGADPNIKDYSGDVPLLKILYGGYEPLEKHRREALALLLEQTKNRTDVDVMPPGTLNRPLHLAVRRQDPYAIGMLLEKGAKVNEPNGAGVTPLALAVGSWGTAKSAYRMEVLEQLLCHGAVVDERIGTPESTALHLAVIYGQVELAELLLQYNADPNAEDKEGETAFTMAVYLLKDRRISRSTHATLLRLLFRHTHEAILEVEGTCALVSAVKNSDLQAAAILLRRGANARNWGIVDGQQLLDIACSGEDLGMMALLKEMTEERTDTK